MKRFVTSIIFILALVFSTAATAQKYEYLGVKNFPVDSATYTIQYSGVVSVGGASKQILYSRAKEWLGNYYKSAKAVIQSDDAETGVLIGEAATLYRGIMNANPTPWYYHITIRCKDNKFKYEITSIRYGQSPLETTIQSNPPSKKVYDMIFSGLNQQFRNLETDLKASMQKDSLDF